LIDSRADVRSEISTAGRTVFGVVLIECFPQSLAGSFMNADCLVGSICVIKVG
jgi:hypothetical protein